MYVGKTVRFMKRAAYIAGCGNRTNPHGPSAPYFRGLDVYYSYADPAQPLTTAGDDGNDDEEDDDLMLSSFP